MAIVRQYQPGALLHYRHFSAPSARILDSFWASGRIVADFVIYDYPLGVGRPAPDGTPPKMAAGWQYLNQLKADMIIFTPQNVFICEIKPTMDVASFGQVLAYAWFYKRDHPEFTSVSPIIITEITHPDLITLAEEWSIDVIQATPQSITYANKSTATPPIFGGSYTA